MPEPTRSVSDVQGADFAKLLAFARANAELEDKGLILHDKVERTGGYWCSLPQLASFASTGGDGVSFGFLQPNQIVRDTDPVVMTVPMQFDHPHLVLGQNLREFLALGCRIGYYVLEELCYDFEATCQRIEIANMDPAASQVLNGLEGHFGLQPIADPKTRLTELQTQYAKGLKKV